MDFLKTVVLSLLFPSVFCLSPYRLRVEYSENPFGLDVTSPRFFWALSFSGNGESVYNINNRGDYQTAYEIVIYDIDNSSALLIDTGKITSNLSNHIEINNFTPESHKDYKWCIKVWNSTDISSSYDDIDACGTFTMGLLNGESDWDNATWLGITSGNVNEYNNNEFLYQFNLNSSYNTIYKARCYIASPNYYKAWINDNLLDDHELGYFTTFEETIYYDTIDCKSNLNFGQNTFSLMLGQGWYSQSSVHVGKPMFRVKIYIELINNNNNKERLIFVSNTKEWYQHTGPVRMNDIYIGEYYNSNYETPGWTSSSYDISKETGWSLSNSINNPIIGTLKSGTIMSKITKTESFSPISITQPCDSTYVIDFGQNIAGFTKIEIPGNNLNGQNVSFIHSEQLYPNGSIQEIYGSKAPMIAIYTLKGDGNVESYQPYFTYFGFQYVQIKNFPGIITTASIKSYFIHSNFDTTQSDISFGPSNIINGTDTSIAGLLNNVQRMTRYASLSNWMNIPTDCPQRERRGWLGDAQLTAEVTIYNFDVPAAYTKFLGDIRDAQLFGNKSGALPDCAPYYGHGRLPGDPSWTAALIFITHWMYHYYGDKRIISDNYDSMKMQLLFLETQLNKTTSLLPESISHYGDWCAVYPDTSGCAHKSTIINTYDYAKQCYYFSKLANILGNKNDSTLYYSKYETSKSMLKKYYFDSPNAGYFIDSKGDVPVSTAQALMFDLNVLTSQTDIDTTLSAMINDIKITNKNHLTTGIIGVKYVLRHLCEMDYCDIALNISIKRNYASFGYWYEQGATTLWENWPSSRYHASGSKNHIMFGTQGIWYYQYLAGIRQKENSSNWDQFIIHPYYNSTIFDIYFINAAVNTLRGNIYVNSHVFKTSSISSSSSNVLRLEIDINVPIGTMCDVYVTRLAEFGKYININDWIVKESDINVFSNGTFNNGVNGVVSGVIDNQNTIIFQVKSGYYSFQLYA